jgi:hypothetical protein
LYLTKEGNLFSLLDIDGRVIKETKTPNGLFVDGMITKLPLKNSSFIYNLSPSQVYYIN